MGLLYGNLRSSPNAKFRTLLNWLLEGKYGHLHNGVVAIIGIPDLRAKNPVLSWSTAISQGEPLKI